ncbi:MAG TPA: DUF1080 domain-containing protein [Burkholderiales bacterium]|nr:DUF1080 domain-containing protein [Burkholderiales bacterium]
MNVATRIVMGLLVIVSVIAGCASSPGGGGWVTLLDGEKGMENFNRIGDANWRAESGAIVADKGKGGHLVSKNSYKDFEVRAEFWAATDTNSGIFIRATDPEKIGSVNSYEVNIWDIRPDPKFGTGAIVDIAAVPVPLKNTVGGKWNVMEIIANGPQLTVTLNGAMTVNVRDTKFAQGPFSLQYGGGVKGAVGGPIKWRKVQVRAL